MLGSEKKYCESNLLKKLAYTFFGEVHVPGRLRAWHVIRKIKETKINKQTSLRVLDAGCGRGDLVVSFANKNKNWHVSGIEINEERLKIAEYLKEKLDLTNLSLMHGSLLDFKSAEAFDLITCCDVLEHIENDEEVIKSLYNSLRTGGMLLMTFPSIPQRKHLGLVAMRENRIGFKNEDYGHVRDGYSIEGIKATLKKIGFSSSECQYTFGFWGTLSFDLFFVIGDNKPNPLLFLLSFPFLLAFAAMDIYFPSKQGSALLVVAKK